MKKQKIAILGAGNIGTSLARGLISSGQVGQNDILLSEKREERVSYLRSQGFNVTNDNCQAVRKS